MLSNRLFIIHTTHPPRPLIHDSTIYIITIYNLIDNINISLYIFIYIFYIHYIYISLYMYIIKYVIIIEKKMISIEKRSSYISIRTSATIFRVFITFIDEWFFNFPHLWPIVTTVGHISLFQAEPISTFLAIDFRLARWRAFNIGDHE